MKLLLVLILGVASAQVGHQNVFERFSNAYPNFIADIYNEIAQVKSGNFWVSPMSAHIILAMVHYGARGETALEISQALHLPADKYDIFSIYDELIPRLKGDDNYDIFNANKIYIKDGYDINQEFKETAVESFHSDVEHIDFVNNEESAAAINKWVADQTHGYIKDLVNSDDLDSDTFAVLINAMYFHANWVHQFNIYFTKPRDFHVNNTYDEQLDMMLTIQWYKYYECEDTNAKFLEMPYKTHSPDNDVSMTFVVPNEIDGLSKLEKNIKKITAGPGDRYDTKIVAAAIPKFKVETTIDFKEVLMKLGVVKAFSNSADFHDLYDGEESLKISKVLQKNFIEVGEKGTTAAPARKVESVVWPGGAIPVAQKEFVADHPFIYYIKSEKAGVLFVGRYMGNQ